MSKNNNDERFTGGDHLTGTKKHYNEAMMQNELINGKGAYKFSFAEGKSGASFGGNQMDISTSAENSKAAANIFINAKDQVPGISFSEADINTINEKLNPKDELKQNEKPRLNSLKAPAEKIFGAELTAKMNKKYDIKLRVTLL